MPVVEVRVVEDFTHDRQLVERMIDSILVYPEGSLVVQLREASLFEPMKFGRLPRLEPKPASDQAGLKARRNAYGKELEELRSQAGRVLTPEQLGSWEYDLLPDAEGVPDFIMGARARPGGTERARPNEITWASPGGIGTFLGGRWGGGEIWPEIKMRIAV